MFLLGRGASTSGSFKGLGSARKVREVLRAFINTQFVAGKVSLLLQSVQSCTG